jgi:hypothetical protein
MALLTDRVLATGVTLSDYIHVVIPSDISQNPAGSSYKATVSQVADVFSNLFVNQSGDTMTGTLIVPTISATTYQNLPQDVYVTGMTFNNSNYDLTIFRNDGVSFSDDLSILASEITVTGGTYNPTTGVVVFTNNTGGTFDVSGFTTGYTDVKVTAYTYSSNTFTIYETDGSTHDATINTMTGLTINGGLNVTGNTSLQSTTASTLNISSTPTTDSSISVVLVRDSVTGVVKQRDITSTLNKNYASFYDTGDQTGLAGTELTMSANTSDSWNTGITLSANTRFVIQNPGVYSLAFSAQMLKTGGNNATHAHIWLYQNGLDVPYSASQIGFPSNSVYVVPAWNFFFSTTTPNEYVELKWEINSNVNNQLLLKYQPAAGNVPEIPSLIVTINQVN